MIPYRVAILSSSLDPDARNWIQRVREVGGSVSNQFERGLNDFVRGCKTDSAPLGGSNWAAIGFLHLYIAGGRFESCAVPLKGPVPGLPNFVSADWNTSGLKGNAISKFVNTNYADNSTEQNNVSRFVWIESAGTGGSMAEIGALNANDVGAHQLLRGSTAERVSRSRTSTAFTRPGEALTIGFHGISRSSSDQYFDRLNGSEQTASIVPNGIATSNVVVFGRGTPAAPASLSDARLSIAGGGAAVDLGALYTRLQTLRSAAGL